MAVIDLTKAPKNVLGFKMTEVMHRIPLVAKSEAFSLTDASSDGVVKDVFIVPANTLILRTYAEVTVASTSTGKTVSLGDSDSATRFMADTDILPETLGIKAMNIPYIYTDRAVIQTTLKTDTGAGTTPSQGTIYYLIEYLPDYDLLPKNQK